MALTADDAALVTQVATVLSRPKVAPADSFVLHAPLELLARAGLLGRLPLDAREPARARLRGLAAQYASAGDEVDDPGPPSPVAPEALAAALVDALAAGELDDVDRLSARLGSVADPAALRRLLAAPVAASLAAAGHASILLWLLPRVGVAVPGALLRGPARELARHPGWRLHWFEAAGEPTDADLTAALLDVPILGVPGTTFIHPVMQQAEESGVARRLLAGLVEGPLDLREIGRQVARIAAWSMLQEPDDHAAYGWSHCLTMPQAVLGIAAEGRNPRAAVAVATTHVVGFRAALGTVRLDPDHVPAPPVAADLAEALALGPDEAASFAWHTAPADRPALVLGLAANASRHHDAHLVKCTLAAFDAVDLDPAATSLHLASAAHLAGWWAQQPTDGFAA